MKQAIAIGAALVAGFIGGILGTRLTHMADRPVADSIVRARSFELVDKTGKVISFWGVDVLVRMPEGIP